MFIFVFGALGLGGVVVYKVWNVANSATNTMKRVDETLDRSQRTMAAGRRTMSDMQDTMAAGRRTMSGVQDTMAAGRRTMSGISTSIDRSLINICWNFSLITNAILGLAACWALYFLARSSDFMHPAVQFGIWNIIVFICCWMIIKYFEHSDMLERSRSNKCYRRYKKNFKLLLSFLVSVVVTAITYGFIAYFYHGNVPTGAKPMEHGDDGDHWLIIYKIYSLFAFAFSYVYTSIAYVLHSIYSLSASVFSYIYSGLSYLVLNTYLLFAFVFSYIYSALSYVVHGICSFVVLVFSYIYTSLAYVGHSIRSLFWFI